MTKHVIAMYRCVDDIDGPDVRDVPSKREVANFVFRETQRSILEDTDLFALDEWTAGDVTHHIYFEVLDLEWFECHVEDIMRLVSEDFDVSVENLRNITPLVE